jgi:GxxExxY protein
MASPLHGMPNVSGELNQITGIIIDSAIRIHRDLGPGLLESVCESVLARHLGRRGLQVERQVLVSFEYDGLRFDQALRVDLLVERQVVVEVKSQERLAPVHARQVLTYLKLMNLPIGLLINFGEVTLKSGVKRIIHDRRPKP